MHNDKNDAAADPAAARGAALPRPARFEHDAAIAPRALPAFNLNPDDTERSEKHAQALPAACRSSPDLPRTQLKSSARVALCAHAVQQLLLDSLRAHRTLRWRALIHQPTPLMFKWRALARWPLCAVHPLAAALCRLPAALPATTRSLLRRKGPVSLGRATPASSLMCIRFNDACSAERRRTINLSSAARPVSSSINAKPTRTPMAHRWATRGWIDSPRRASWAQAMHTASMQPCGSTSPISRASTVRTTAQPFISVRT